jgi:S1-C subfamily serine protease
VQKDPVEAVKWYRKAAEQGNPLAQLNLAVCLEKDPTEAAKWYRKAAEQGVAQAQFNLGVCYFNGEGVLRNYVQAYKWLSLASAQGAEGGAGALNRLEGKMTREEVTEALRLAERFAPQAEGRSAMPERRQTERSTSPSGGTGFLVTQDGYVVTCEHVVREARTVKVLHGGRSFPSVVVRTDAANDLALVKIAGRFNPLPLASSRTARLGTPILTLGFPNPTIQGSAPKLAKGEIAALSGPGDDPRYFQVSLPVQPGNSGGALIDERGNVIGVVAAKLDPAIVLAVSGALPENVNYAIKGSFLLGFLEAVPEVSGKIGEPNTKSLRSEDLVKAAEDAAVLIMVE